jgi:preprotein translocase subunit SecF
MFRILHDTHFEFMKYRRLWIVLSTVLNIVALGLIFIQPGFKYGVDFAGGTQVTIKLKSTPDLGRIRSALEGLNLGTVTIQRFDEPGRNELLLRVQNPGQEGDFSAQMLAALDRELNQQGSDLRLNQQGMDAIRDRLVQADPGGVGGTIEARRAVYEPMAKALLDKRRQIGIFTGPADIAGMPELSAAVRDYLAQAGRFGEFSILAVDNVGPTVGADLREKATYAILFSILAMLIYIAFRFHLPYGIGAIVALAHDTLVTLGALAVTAREIDITVIAALLTLVGYSVNDKVVIFDRIRERLKLERGKSLIEVMNSAINQTLSRTIITGGGTLAVLVALFLFGGDVINTFSFALLLGIVVGTYSSIYVASPVALWITNLFERRKLAKRRR